MSGYRAKVLGVLCLCAQLLGCATMRQPPSAPAPAASGCPQWRSAQAGWEWVDSYVRWLLEQEVQAACREPQPTPVPPTAPLPPAQAPMPAQQAEGTAALPFHSQEPEVPP